MGESGTPNPLSYSYDFEDLKLKVMNNFILVKHDYIKQKKKTREGNHQQIASTTQPKQPQTIHL